MNSAWRDAGKEGFTLIEVLVGLSVMAIALVAVISSALQIQESLIRTREQNLVAELASNRLARIKARGVDEILVWSGDFKDNPAFHWELEINPTGIEGMTDLRLYVSRKSRPEDTTLFQEYVLEQAALGAKP